MTESKELILKVAYKLFLQKSFKAVTMKEIVEKTGLSKGAFYHYFTSKEQLFEEVINQFFLNNFEQDYSRYSHESLKAFYTEFIDKFIVSNEMFFGLSEGEEEPANNNFFSLIFEAMRIIPGFKEKNIEHKDIEQKAWIKIVAMAREAGEINPKISDERVANLFIYSQDAAGLHMIMDNNTQRIKAEVKSVWDSIYELIKA